MNLTPIQIKLLAGLITFSVAALALSACFYSGIVQGENNITVLWQAEKLETAKEIARLRGTIDQKELGHRQETARIADQLRKTEIDYEKATASLAAEHSQRLRLAAERADVYSRFAETGPAQCRGLASHAAGLDGSLEEGRGLVAELQAALGHRDQQLRLLGSQITTDRKLLEVR